ncbi:MAG TPA: S8 family serine peptidase [Saprospiraceae bacterium]|nr:S8 family serine peptidase [Saprospiraceae bacterium]
MVLACLLPCGGQAQGMIYVKGEYLIAVDPDKRLDDLLRRLDAEVRYKRVSEMQNIWLIQATEMPEESMLRWLRQQPEVRLAQLNHILESREQILNLLPNDPHFTKQWHLLNDGSIGGLIDADLDAEDAWNITTGGLTPAGDTIVLAVIDGGIDAQHPDLAANLWHNWLEIPNNGLDDDQNGFVDDFRGWNVFNQNDAIEGSVTTHGTPVSGILGATGDNGVGVTGVTWNTQMMFVSALGTESEILAAYDYVWKLRKLYNETSGEKGAFVVAVNCSWGINYGQPSESPIWCEAFDILGEAGILSVAATANIPVNVDEVGDLPTACPSLYLLSVTSLNQQDQKAENAAWGPGHIDIGAYGQEVFTTASGSGYGVYSGTSFATPQVSGAVGLLYASPCPSLISLAKSHPASAAYWVKTLILDAKTPNQALEDITVSGGRLNLNQTLLHYEGQCNDCPPPFALKVNNVTDTSAMLNWSTPAGASSVNVRWRRAGQGLWNILNQVNSGMSLDALWACTAYEFEMQAVCSDSLISAWTAPLVFETKGCCSAPGEIWLETVNNESARIGWNAESFNNTYRLRITNLLNGAGQVVETDTSIWTLEGLEPCTDYQVQVQARCEDWLTPYSAPFFFKTKGCGACNELTYCSISGVSSAQEWISSVQLGPWTNVSGIGGNGYQNYSLGPIVSPVLFENTQVPLLIIPGFLGTPTKQYFRVYLDFNQDGDFQDDNEVAYDPGFAFIGIAEGFLQIPSFELEGMTRMRVVMRYSTPNDPPPGACGGFEFGQVEDYCVLLQKDSIFTESTQPESDHTLHLYPQPASNWAVMAWNEHVDTGLSSVRVFDMSGREVFQKENIHTTDHQYRLDTQSWPAGLYLVEWQSGRDVLRGKLVKN